MNNLRLSRTGKIKEAANEIIRLVEEAKAYAGSGDTVKCYSCMKVIIDDAARITRWTIDDVEFNTRKMIGEEEKEPCKHRYLQTQINR